MRRPMPYASALNGLRAALRNLTGGSAPTAVPLWRTYSLHGAKATMLSWARQLAAPEDMRREQGHHKVDGGKSSVRLYSRDDVWGPLRLQVGVVQALHSGWRPLSPQARGALPSIPEAPIDLPPHQIMYVLPPPCACQTSHCRTQQLLRRMQTTHASLGGTMQNSPNRRGTMRMVRPRRPSLRIPVIPAPAPHPPVRGGQTQAWQAIQVRPPAQVPPRGGTPPT